MYYELALISVLVAGGYWGWYFVRHDQTRLYGALQLAAAGLSGLGLIGHRLDKPGLGVPGAIGVGAGVCLLLVAPLARGLARRLAAGERFRAALKLLDAAEILAPGSGVADDKALVYAMREIRDGNIDQTVDALTAAKVRMPVDAHQAIDERVAMLYLAAYRWDEAIAYAEEHLFGAIPSGPTGEPSSSHVALRRALGLAPPVFVELLGAYGYKGDLDQAARMLARLEEVCAGRPDAGIWLHRGRLMFLALAGRVDAVNAMVEPRRSRHMKPSARQYWVAVAHERQGKVAVAEATYAKARARTRGRPRLLIDQALERLPHARPAELGPTASEVVARVEAEPVPVVTARVRPRGPIATRTLVAAILIWATAIGFLLDGSTDLGTLVRGGAMVRGLVHEGEWWRVIAFSFVHIGGLHLLVNVLGLWMLGRLVEDLFGPWRTVAIYAVSAIGGALASLFAVPAGVAAGASGAIFGMVGALFVELSLHRRVHRAAWSRGVWGSLVVIAVAQLGIGFVYPVMDQWAHGAGLASGALAGLVLSPHVRWQRIAEYAARAVSVAVAAAAIVAAVFVARTSMADSLASGPRALFEVDRVHVIAPASWQAASDGVYFPDLNIILEIRRVDTDDSLAAVLARDTQSEPDHARQKGFDRIDTARTSVVPLPSGWQGSELVATVDDGLGGRQRYRVIVAGRPVPGGHISISFYMPESIARAVPDLFTQVISSVQ
jgi:rhomboid protease GluP